MDDILTQVKEELLKAQSNYPAFHSSHEGYAVLLEEVDELWDQVKLKGKDRNLFNIRKECIQIAAMAIRFHLELCNEEKIRI